MVIVDMLCLFCIFYNYYGHAMIVMGLSSLIYTLYGHHEYGMINMDIL